MNFKPNPNDTKSQTDVDLTRYYLSEHSALSGILERHNIPFFAVNTGYCYTTFNQSHADAMRRLYGAEIEIGKNILDYQTVAEDRAKAKRNLDRALSGEQVMEEAYSGEDNRERLYFLISHDPIRDSNNSIVGVAVLARDITVRKKLEKDLQTKEVEHQKVLKSLDDHVVGLDENWQIQYVNHASPSMDVEAVLGSSWLTWIHEEDRTMADQALRQTIDSGEPNEIECRAIGPQHEMAWFRVKFNRMSNGSPIKVVLIATDITAHKKSEEKLRERERLLAEAERIGHVGSWRFDLVDQIIWSDETYRIFGVSSDTFAPSLSTLEDLLHPDDREAMSQWIANCVGGKKPNELACRAIRPDGTLRHLIGRGELICDAEGQPLYMAGTAQDVTEHKRAKDSLRNLSRAVEQSPATIAITDTTGAIEYVNPKFTEMTGYTLEEAIGQNPRILKSGNMPGETYQNMWATLTSGETWRGELINKKKNGELFWESASISPIRNETGETTHYVAVKEDITARKQMELDLKAANDELESRVAHRTAQLEITNLDLHRAKEEADKANAAKSEFLSRMSHELRTPLNAILGFGQLLSMADLSPRQKEQIEYILKGGHHLLGLINEVLDLARIETGRISLSPEPVPVSQVAAELFDLLQPLTVEKHIRLINEVSKENNLHVWADQQRLRQLLVNLLNNAIKYNRDQGTVTLSCELIPADNSPANAIAENSSEKPQNYLRFNVRDTGLGLTEQEMKHLFESFVRLHPDQEQIEGSGIGLTVTKRIAEAMDGRAGVESTVGQGSTFWVELPQAESPIGEQQPMSGDQIAADNSVSAEKFTVLYIEDNLSNLQLVKSIMAERPSIHLLSAMRGQEGIDMARAHIPNMILLDLHLPDMSGEDVLRQLRAESATREIPIVVLSADAMPRHVAKLKAAGAKDYLTKPLNVLEFLSVLDKTLTQNEG